LLPSSNVWLVICDDEECNCVALFDHPPTPEEILDVLPCGQLGWENLEGIIMIKAVPLARILNRWIDKHGLWDVLR